MKRFALQIFLAVGILLSAAETVSAQALPSFSTWLNDKGSTLNVQFVDPNGQFYGFYINRASGFQCQNVPYPVAGTVLPNGAITFVVNFTNCNTLTTWKGRVLGARMPTKWLLIYNGVQRMTGADFFTRQ